MQRSLVKPNCINGLSESLTNVKVHISFPTWMVSRCDSVSATSWLTWLDLFLLNVLNVAAHMCMHRLWLASRSSCSSFTVICGSPVGSTELTLSWLFCQSDRYCVILLCAVPLGPLRGELPILQLRSLLEVLQYAALVSMLSQQSASVNV